MNNGGVSQRCLARESMLQLDKRILMTDFTSHIALARALLPHMHGDQTLTRARTRRPTPMSTHSRTHALRLAAHRESPAFDFASFTQSANCWTCLLVLSCAMTP